jgi:predicted NACHT family NTPase
MITPDELIAILTRLLDGSREEKDIEQFRNWSKTGEGQIVIQFVIQQGKYSTNIVNAQGIEIGDRLDTELFKEIRDLVRSQQASQSPARSSASMLDIDWHTISRTLLTEHRHLTTNQIVADRDMHRELDEMYVSLALVERKKPERQSEQARLWQDTSLSEPEYEEKQLFEHQQFLQDILRAGKGKSQGKRIAIIGEPGAGKTTLLCKIAFWLAGSSEDIPIVISLADLQERSLEEYLLQKWLKDALKVVRVMPQQEEALRSLFERGRVWLLLDGADEMTTGAYLRSPLQTIQSELTGWVGQARVILTCRLNLWDAIPNALLTQFEIYRTLPFSYGDGKTSDQVGEFITKWFKGEQLGQELRQALEQPGKERIKDLAKNPLRLALLCRTWHLWREQGGLPDTKAKLYQGFVDDFYNFYESRPNKPHVKKQQRRKLNEALGKLAKWALDQPTARFRLSLSQIPEPLAQILGDGDEEGSLLWWLVSELSWLVNIGDSAESPGDTVYTFFHPTFQEYFAALAIDDWHFFLNHIPENPHHPDASYRIFEPQWKEIFLLWLGREDIEKECKEAFFETLVNFEDNCEYFYQYRAYFIAASGIAEFRKCKFANEIIDKVITLSLGHFAPGRQKQCTLLALCPKYAVSRLLLRMARFSRKITRFFSTPHPLFLTPATSQFTNRQQQRLLNLFPLFLGYA